MIPLSFLAEVPNDPLKFKKFIMNFHTGTFHNFGGPLKMHMGATDIGQKMYTESPNIYFAIL